MHSLSSLISALRKESKKRSELTFRENLSLGLPGIGSNKTLDSIVSKKTGKMPNVPEMENLARMMQEINDAADITDEDRVKQALPIIEDFLTIPSIQNDPKVAAILTNTKATLVIEAMSNKMHELKPKNPVTFYYSDKSPEEIFQEGVTAGGYMPGMKRLIFPEHESMHIKTFDIANPAHLTTDATSNKTPKYVYMLSAPHIHLSSYQQKRHMNTAIVPRAIEPHEIIGVMKFDGEKLSSFSENPGYGIPTIEPSKDILLYRADTRKPHKIFSKDGLKPYNTHSSDVVSGHTDLWQSSIFVSGSKTLRSAARYPESLSYDKERFVYVMLPSKRNFKVTDAYPQSGYGKMDEELLMPLGADPDMIIGAYRVANGEALEFFENPDSLLAKNGISAAEFIESCEHAVEAEGEADESESLEIENSPGVQESGADLDSTGSSEDEIAEGKQEESEGEGESGQMPPTI